jgi:hypothetical protein
MSQSSYNEKQTNNEKETLFTLFWRRKKNERERKGWFHILQRTDGSSTPYKVKKRGLENEGTD